MIALRLVLGLVFVVSSWTKIRYPRIFAESLLAYHVLPETLVTFVAVTLPWLELLAGLAMLFGYRHRGSAIVLSGLSLLFAIVLSSAVWKGLDIGCGCFVGVEWMKVKWWHIVANLVFFGLAGAVFFRGPGRWAMEKSPAPNSHTPHL